MNAFAATAGFLARKTFLVVLVMAALAFYQFAWPQVSAALSGDLVRSEWRSLPEIGAELRRDRAARVEAFDILRTRLGDLRGRALETAISDRRKKLKQVRVELSQPDGFLAAFRPSSRLRRGRLQLEERALEAEIDALELGGNVEKLRFDLSRISYPALAGNIDIRRKRCEAANGAVRRFNSKTDLEQAVRNRVADEAENLSRIATARCKELRTAIQQRKNGISQAQHAQKQLAEAEKQLSDRATELRNALEEFDFNLAGRTLKDLFLRALAIVLMMIMTPFAIRLFFFHFIAPAAARRAPVRIGQTSPASGKISSGTSRFSIPVRVLRGEEIVLRQGYNVRHSTLTRKPFRFFLDWRHPLRSMAAGMTGLKVLSGGEDKVAVFPAADCMDELAEIGVPSGASLVIRPRALAGVVQPENRPVRISVHWRIATLNAWLLSGLRSVVLHGPVRVLIKGGKGVSIESARNGRVFPGQSLLAHSGGLAKSATRTDDKWRYLTGRDRLLKERIYPGDGVVIFEEAISSSGSGSQKKGLEGVVDAALTATGR